MAGVLDPWPHLQRSQSYEYIVFNTLAYNFL